ncbi:MULTISPECIES: YciI family protein [unclassified Streptomyces]|uniref:YciI family protein n=1 Tax=unclassified Streptomyces TaxID=2593676 RepID=UPI0036625AAE
MRVGERIEAMGARVVHEQRLEPSAATRTIHKDGLVTDGPFIESKEVIAGFFVVETTDLETAVAVGKLLPIMDGAVEVRPLLPVE